jgi:imidazolonepropionase-like amidohydrolase
MWTFSDPRWMCRGVTTVVFLLVFAALIGCQTLSQKHHGSGYTNDHRPVIAFVNVSVIPMDTERVLSNQTVLIQGDRILSMGETRAIQIPAGAIRIDGHAKFLIPGLADMHVHFVHSGHYGESRTIPPTTLRVDSAEIERMLLRALVNGIVTVRNMDWLVSEPADPLDTLRARSAFLLRLRERVATGAVLGPQIYTASRWWDTPTLQLTAIAPQVAAYQAAGFDFIKPYHETAVAFDSLAAAAHRMGLPLAGHVPVGVPLQRALMTMTSIEHLSGYSGHPADTTRIRRLAAATQQAGVWNCPTQAHMLGHQLGDQAFRMRLVQALQAAGAGLLLGTDSPLGSSIHQELQAFVISGLTPYQALRTGTWNVAAYFGTLDERGSIAVGKRADLVLLTGNPLTDIRHTRQPVGVMLSGRWFPREELEQQINNVEN